MDFDFTPDFVKKGFLDGEYFMTNIPNADTKKDNINESMIIPVENMQGFSSYSPKVKQALDLTYNINVINFAKKKFNDKGAGLLFLVLSEYDWRFGLNSKRGERLAKRWFTLEDLKQKDFFSPIFSGNITVTELSESIIRMLSNRFLIVYCIVLRGTKINTDRYYFVMFTVPY